MEDQRKARIVLIVDDGQLSRWQQDALGMASDICTVCLVLNCTNTRTRRNWFRYGFYYLLNLFTIRNSWTRRRPLKAGSNGPVMDFQSDYEGIWQELPDEVVARIASVRPDAIVKFGMNLLRVPTDQRLEAPVLSYHHGDPERFRGRPAGYYELVQDEPQMGVIVQAIDNVLDAGAVFARCMSPVFAYSYRKTLEVAFANSVPLLRMSLMAIRDRVVPTANRRSGVNYRLPSNYSVVKFVSRMSLAMIRHLVYGACFQKRWRVAFLNECNIADPGLVELDNGRSDIAVSREFLFYADPFYGPRGSIFFEALRKSSGLGEICQWEGGAVKTVLSKPQHHFSYPQAITVNGNEALLPEIASWSSPHLFFLDDSGREVRVVSLKGLEGERILDPTYFCHQGVHYVFGTPRLEAGNVLDLWVSRVHCEGPYVKHPASPVCVGSMGSRMAGSICRIDGRVLRMGQIVGSRYGDGVAVFEIERLSPVDYAEKFLRTIRVRSGKGPHTVNTRNNQVLFDWYEDQFSVSAGWSRLKAIAMSRAGSLRMPARD